MIDEIEFDESTGMNLAQVSVPVVDPSSNTVVGAVTVGLNIDALE